MPTTGRRRAMQLGLRGMPERVSRNGAEHLCAAPTTLTHLQPCAVDRREGRPRQGLGEASLLAGSTGRYAHIQSLRLGRCLQRLRVVDCGSLSRPRFSLRIRPFAGRPLGGKSSPLEFDPDHPPLDRPRRYRGHVVDDAVGATEFGGAADAGAASQHAPDICLREIPADRGGRRVPRPLAGEAIAEIEAGGVEAASPLPVDLADAPSRMAPWRNTWPAREPP
jgi:hypothetical protein